MGKNRIELRRQAEAAEAQAEEKTSTTAKKSKVARTKVAKDPVTGEKVKKKAVRKTREKAREKKRAIWVIYSGTMREEGRYPYWEKQAAEERLELLRSRGKRLYFMQMVKELIVGDGQVQTVVPQLDEDEVATPVVGAPAVDAEEGGLSIQIDDGDFSDADEGEEEEAEAGDEEE